MKDFCCTFCREITSLCPQAELFQFNLSIYFCFNCKAEFVFIGRDLSPFSEAIYTSINGIHYKYYYFCDSYSIYSIENLGIPGKSLNKGQKRIAQFKHPLDLNPTNINERLKNILNFL